MRFVILLLSLVYAYGCISNPEYSDATRTLLNSIPMLGYRSTTEYRWGVDPEDLPNYHRFDESGQMTAHPFDRTNELLLKWNSFEQTQTKLGSYDIDIMITAFCANRAFAVSYGKTKLVLFAPSEESTRALCDSVAMDDEREEEADRIRRSDPNYRAVRSRC